MHRVVIHFGNGKTQKVSMRKNFPAGSASRVIDIEGKNRVIKKVVFYYDTKNIRPKRGTVELWGRH